MKLPRFVRSESVLIVPLIVVAAGAASRVYGQFTSGINLVEVYASVSDHHGDPLIGLTADDFRVVEDGVPQTIRTFAAGEFPLAVGSGLDRSFRIAAKASWRAAGNTE